MPRFLQRGSVRVRDGSKVECINRDDSLDNVRVHAHRTLRVLAPQSTFPNTETFIMM